MQPFERLELEWAKFNDLDPAGMVACSSGTAALHLALEALDLRNGWEVIVPDYSMVAIPRACTLAGRTPVFVDCTKDKLLLDPEDLIFQDYGRQAGMIGAVIAVHNYGRTCDMKEFSFYAGDNAYKVVEDLAEAHGVRPHETTDAACWSFYKNKIVAGEEGGAVWFRNPDHAKLARSLRTLGFTDAHDYTHVPRGHNYRMSNIHAEAILNDCTNGEPEYGSIEAIMRRKNMRRREIESWYDAECPTEWRQPPRDAVWVYDFRIPGMTAKQQTLVVTELRREGIAARYGFKPCRRQEEYNTNCGHWEMEPEWESDRAAREVIYLPVEPGVTTREVVKRRFEIIQRTLTLQSPE